MHYEHFKKSRALAVLLVLFICLTGLRIYFIAYPGQEHYNALVWGTLYQIVAFWGAVCGLYMSRQWGGVKSLIGKVTLLFSIGLLAQCFGQSVSSYYFFTGGQVAYPSIADIGFFGSVLLYIWGVLLLAKTAGVTLSFKSMKAKVFAVIFPMILLIGSYFIFLKGYTVDWNAPVKTFLDFGYPLGQAFYLSVAILTASLSQGVLGGIMKKPLMLFVVALLLQYFSDFTFLYQSNAGTYVAGGMVDFMYFVAYFVMALSLIQFGVIFDKVSSQA